MASEQAATYFTPEEDLYAEDEPVVSLSNPLEEDMPEYVES